MTNARHGYVAITNYWKESLKYIKECKLNMESIEGTKEILYETGHGFSLIANDKEPARLDTFKFKYVNVWK
jgi:hypothetical protein